MLIQGFNTFIPAGYRIECATDVPHFNYIVVVTPWGETARLQRIADDGALSQSSASPVSLQETIELSESCSSNPSSDGFDLELGDLPLPTPDDVSPGHSPASSTLSLAESHEEVSVTPVLHHGMLSVDTRCEK